ncbi:AarF/ABC1/UbiB kinase family protein [Cyanobium sp. NIES-981]|uniref:ABC1 kinase family protein n=1 Tax=Cyanobium sp. NIES-981 TaxID=1851505 RepID=UPI0007DDEE94|nr:AarF/UbiB family protein [Cyanobium sp. NIES-981]SBO42256.1 ABC1 family protein [Cyanobium sp. NIES-981]
MLSGSSRALEIVRVVSQHQWDYLLSLLSAQLGTARAAQPSLPAPEVLCRVLTELGPVFVKVGQLLSTRPDLLPQAYIRALARLQSDVPPAPWPAVESILLHQLDAPLDQVFARFDTTPVAAGSIGQVHRATLPDATAVAVKVLRPGIDRQVEEDGQLLRQIAALAAQTPLGASYDLPGLADQLIGALEGEIDFRSEASHTERLAEVLRRSSFVGNGSLRVPAVYAELSGPAVLVLEWLDGDPILSEAGRAALQACPDGLEGATNNLLGAFVEQFFVEGFFDADPHPGNLMVAADGTITLLDLGMVGSFDPRTRTLVLDLVLALINEDPARATDLLVQLAPPLKATADRRRLRRQLDQLIRSNFAKPLHELNFARFLADLLQIANRAGLQVPGNLGLFVKAITNLEGVGRDLNPGFSFTEAMKPLVSRLMARALLLPQQRVMQFGLDLRTLLLDSPRQLSGLLQRFSGDELVFTFQLQGLEQLLGNLDVLSRRIALAILVASLLLSATVMATQSELQLLRQVSQALFVAANVLGVWLVVSLMRSGRR